MQTVETTIIAGVGPLGGRRSTGRTSQVAYQFPVGGYEPQPSVTVPELVPGLQQPIGYGRIHEGYAGYVNDEFYPGDT